MFLGNTPTRVNFVICMMGFLLGSRNGGNSRHAEVWGVGWNVMNLIRSACSWCKRLFVGTNYLEPVEELSSVD